MKVPAEDEAFFRKTLLQTTREDIPIATDWELDKIYQFHHHRTYSRGFEGLLFVVKKNEAGELYLDYYFQTDDTCTHYRISRDGQLTRLENIIDQWTRKVYEDEEQNNQEQKRVHHHNEEVRRILKEKGFDESRWTSPAYRKEMTVAQIKHRWTTDWLPHASMVTRLLQNGTPLTESIWNYTIDGRLDLQGYTVPQEKSEHIPPHRKTPVVLQGPRLRKLKFINLDLSHSNWESTEFHSCHFENCVFDSARMRDARFYGCTFTRIHFKKTDFGEAYFGTSLSFFKRRKINFSDVTFENCNFSRGYILSQELERCAFRDCKTGELQINDCKLDNISFSGTVHNLFLEKNKALNVDLRECFLRGMTFGRQHLDGFLLPEGDGYYVFKNTVEDIEWLRSQPLTDHERKTFDTLAFIWTHDNERARFTDIHFLDPDEQEVARRLLQMLKNR